MKIDIESFKDTVSSILSVHNLKDMEYAPDQSTHYFNGYPVYEVMKIKELYPIEKLDYDNETLIKVKISNNILLVFVCSDSDLI